MPRYPPHNSGPSSPTDSPLARRPSLSFLAHSRQPSQMPDPNEMDAAFDGPDEHEDDDDMHGGRDGEDARLLRRSGEREWTPHVPGDYDFDRDYSPPPFQPYSALNPAPGNTNGVIPQSTPARPVPHARHFLGGILPTALLPRQQPGTHATPPPGLGGGRSGVFANLAARPDGHAEPGTAGGTEGPEWAPEIASKEAPPSYQAALRDAVPPYWDTTVVLPSASSPFGPLSSSITGDDVLIDGMPSGNFFGFFWNLLVSVSFQFVGFLLTYVLHTTHAAKYGSRAGLGLTLIQFGFSMRSRAEDLINSGHFPGDGDVDASSGKSASDIEAENALSSAYWGTGSPWPAKLFDPEHPDQPPYIAQNADEAEHWAYAHNTTLAQLIGLPSAVDVGRANEWFSFLLMTVGWFLVLTSVGQWWRIKRFERKLRQAQRVSEAAQQAAAAGDNGAPNVATGVVSTRMSGVGQRPASEPTSATTPATPLEARYYTSVFSQALEGARAIRDGFHGMNGPRLAMMGRRGGGGGRRGTGHAPLSQHDDGDDDGADGAHELLDAQGFGLDSMAADDADRASRRARGLWGV